MDRRKSKLATAARPNASRALHPDSPDQTASVAGRTRGAERRETPQGGAGPSPARRRARPQVDSSPTKKSSKSSPLKHPVRPHTSPSPGEPPVPGSDMGSPSQRPRPRDLTIVDHQEALEVERVLTAGLEETKEVLRFTNIPPWYTVYGRKAISFIIKPFIFVFMAWLFVLVMFAGQTALSWLRPYPEPLPLHYITWSISSNAAHIKAAMENVKALRDVRTVDFENIIVARFANEVYPVDEKAAATLREYDQLTGQLKDSVTTLIVESGFAFRELTRDLSKADRLLKRLSRVNGRDIGLEEDLLSVVSGLYATRLPKQLRQVSQDFWSTGQILRMILQAVIATEASLTANDSSVLRKLDVIPSSASTWIVSPLAQRRTDMYRRVTASFGRAKALEASFRDADIALGNWARDLVLYQSPRDVTSGHRASNASFQGMIRQLDVLIPEIQELAEVWKERSF